MEKTNINLMNLAPRCKGRSKRSGEACKAPAKAGWKVCRMHGAGGGAPEGKGNGNFKHGGYSKRTTAALATVRQLGRMCRATLDELDV